MSAEPSTERARLREAVVEVVIEAGYEGASVEAICERAGIDRAAFERHFADLQAAVIGTYWDYTNEFNERLRAAYERGSDWRSSLRGAAYAAAYYIRDRPQVVRFGTLILFQAGAMAQAERESHLQQMVDLIDAGRGETDDPDSLDRGVAEGAFGSIYESVVRAVRSGEGTRSAPDIVPELMYISVRPYLGQEAAREELAIPPPPERRAGERRG